MDEGREVQMGKKGKTPASQLLLASPAMTSIKTKLYENMWGSKNGVKNRATFLAAL
jgi:hypothetical protein